MVKFNLVRRTLEASGDGSRNGLPRVFAANAIERASRGVSISAIKKNTTERITDTGTNRTKVQWTKVQLFCAVQSAKNSDSEEDMDYRHRKYGIVFYN